MAEPNLRDYIAWHKQYDDPNSDLSKRLRMVQTEVSRFFDETVPRPVRILNVCCGDARDVPAVLADRADTDRVSGCFLEILEPLARRAQARVAAVGLAGRITVRQVDASVTDAYAGAVPADLVLLSGIMGNVNDEDLRRLVYASRSMCAAGATVIWTRGNMEPDRGPQIRGWFRQAGFVGVRLHENIEGSPMRVGVERLDAEPTRLEPGHRLFTFLK